MTTTRAEQRLPAAPLPLTAAALCIGLIALAAAGVITGLGEATQITDPGPLTRWGLPTARYVHHLAMATAIAAAVLAAAVVPPWAGHRRRGSEQNRREHPLYTGLLRIAAAASIVWTVAALAVLVLTFSALSGLPLSGAADFSAGLVDFITAIDAGRAWLAVVLIAGGFATFILAVRSPAAVGFTAVLGLCAIVPLALVGHSSSGDDHIAAVNSLGLHLLGVVLWVGGLVTLALLAPRISLAAQNLDPADQGGAEILGTVMRRYSLLAGLALVTVGASGVVNAALRVETFGQLLDTAYGQMLVLKAGAAVMLAGIGWMHRSWLIPRLAGGPAAGSQSAASAPRLLWQLILVEIALMSAVIGVSTVLGRTPPPVPEELPPDATPARILTGYDLPPEPTMGTFFTLWRIDWLWCAVVVFLAVWYLQAMLRLRRRGDHWPVMRAASWLAGLAVFFWITSGGPAVYGMVTFSGHMVQHMTLTMVAPIFLVMGSPVTLAMRSLPSRTDGSRGAREWILWLVHSKWSRFITHPLVAAVNFAGSLVVFYYTPIFGWALQYHLGHVFMTVHFLLTGYIFALVLIGRDPLPQRPPHFLRLILLLATMAFHAFLAVVISGSETLIQPDWFGNMGHGWFPAIEDQQRGGELMWGLGEIPAVLMGIVAAIQWSTDDKRETRRSDREADRTGDADLEEYNRMFEQLAQRSPHR